MTHWTSAQGGWVQVHNISVLFSSLILWYDFFALSFFPQINFFPFTYIFRYNLKTSTPIDTFHRFSFANDFHFLNSRIDFFYKIGLNKLLSLFQPKKPNKQTNNKYIQCTVSSLWLLLCDVRFISKFTFSKFSVLLFQKLWKSPLVSGKVAWMLFLALERPPGWENRGEFRHLQKLE